MKKIKFSGTLKEICYVIGYWIIFIIIPLFAAYFVTTQFNIKMMEKTLLYIIFISPFMYFIPYLLAKPKSGFFFFICGLFIPFILFYLILYQVFIRNFGPITLL